MRFQNARLTALGSEPAELDITQAMRPGWLAWAAFIFVAEKKPVCPDVSLTIDLRFCFTYTPTEWNGTGQLTFGRATG
jgi:hypothetical protein